MANALLQPFSTHLVNRHLSQVAVIDDAFDQMGETALSLDEATEIWNLIEFDETARKAAVGYQILAGSDDIQPQRLSEILEHEPKNSPLRGIVQGSEFLKRITEGLESVEPICQLLASDLGLTVKKLGSNPAFGDLAGIQLIFLDWRLGLDNDPESIDRSAELAKKIYAESEEANKPLFVLMSSSEDVVQGSLAFRQKSELIAGLFQAVPKKELRDPLRLGMHAVALADSLAPAHVVQRFSDALIGNVDQTAAEFKEAVRALTLSDYANIQLLTLKQEQQPFGDYMSWLLSGYLLNLMLGPEMAAIRAGLDEADFQDHVPALLEPSSVLALMYHAAVFDMGVEPLLYGVPATAGKPPGKPTLNLGDVFLVTTKKKEEAEDAADEYVPAEAPPEGVVAEIPVADPQEQVTYSVAMVLNAQCDLLRNVPDDRSILLLHGQLSPLGERRDTGLTPLFVHPDVHGGQGASILWNFKRIAAVPYGSFYAWETDEQAKKKRIGRMRQLSALTLQKEFASDLTRIGLPVNPPIYQLAEVTVELIVNKGVSETVLISERQARIMPHKGKDRCLLTKPFVQTLITLVERRLENIKAGVQTSPNLSEDDLTNALANGTEWLKLAAIFEIKDEKKFFGELLIVVTNSSPIKALQNSKTILRVVVNTQDGGVL